MAFRDCNGANNGRYRHGHYTGGKTASEYNSWIQMKRRCGDESVRNYKNYGGRGIRVCERWLDSFDSFLADMGPKPGPGYSIDRIDSDGNYEPSNCRWADAVTQNNNTSRNVYLTFYGKTLTAAQWSRISLVHPDLIRNRLNFLGWSAKDAVWRQLGVRGRRITKLSAS